MSKSTIFGWTFEQVAAAKAHHKALTGEELEPTAKSLVTIKQWWVSRRNDEPLETNFVGLKPDTDYGWVVELLKTI